MRARHLPLTVCPRGGALRRGVRHSAGHRGAAFPARRYPAAGPAAPETGAEQAGGGEPRGERRAGRWSPCSRPRPTCRSSCRTLSSQIDELQAKLEDTNYRLAQLSQQIATTNQELKAFRSTPPPAPRLEDGDRRSPAATAAAASGGAQGGEWPRGRSAEPLQLGLQRLPARATTTCRCARVPGVPGELPGHRPGGQRHLLDRRVLLPAAPLPPGGRPVRPGARPLSRAATRRRARSSRRATPTSSWASAPRAWSSSGTSSGSTRRSDEANLARQRLRELGVDAG